MSAGRTALGRRRERARRKLAERIGAMPLLVGEDYGAPIRIVAEDAGESSQSTTWANTFLDVNRAVLQRLDLTPAIDAGVEGVFVTLEPRALLGAVPLLAPSTRRVAAGLVVAPRFGWDATGRLLGDVAFRVEPRIGGLPMVPGSAREVPPWIIAGPVLARMAALLERLTRTFSFHTEDRTAPRGSVDWTRYARLSVPTGAWTRMRCTFPELQLDPWLVGATRWTIERVRDDLAKAASSVAAQRLITLARVLLARLGEGAGRRPTASEVEARANAVLGDVLRAGLEAVGWVNDERGLGGARVLDGLAWSLSGDELWEAWVESFARDVAQRIGAEWIPRGQTRRRFRWESSLRSLESVEPDFGFRSRERTVWIDAKYKFHLELLRQRGWTGATDVMRVAHRADVHQALAYAALADTPAVDAVLAYPLPADGEPQLTGAVIPAGRRRVRLILAGLPFGFPSSVTRDSALMRWRDRFAPSP